MRTGTKTLPGLQKGQLWKTEKGYIRIWHIGKRLIEYKMMREQGMKAVKTQTTTIDTLTEYLKVHKAVLIGASSAVPPAVPSA
jgi:hypothetical protein